MLDLKAKIIGKIYSMKFINIIKYIILAITIWNSLFVNNENEINIIYYLEQFRRNNLLISSNGISNFSDIKFNITEINFTYSIKSGLIETIYKIYFFDRNNKIIKPSNLPLLYNLSVLCNFFSFDIDGSIYSFANIYKNQYYYCTEYSKITDNTKFGIELFKIKEVGEETEYKDFFFFNNKIFNFNQNNSRENNSRFDNNYIYIKYNQLLQEICDYRKKLISLNESYNLISSFMQPPLCLLKNDIALTEGKWYFNNIYENYFCFCKGVSCLNVMTTYNNNFQSCKYYFYLSVIEQNKYIYLKNHYLLSDFFDPYIAPSDAFPIFKEMVERKFKVHYITMSWNIYNQFSSKNEKRIKDFKIIYGIKKLIGDVLEKYLELWLKLKVVVASEKYDGIDNFFYNIDYIIYIFLGHGIQYIKSYLYNDYLSPKMYNKIVLPPSERIISVALEGGWKNEDIIKITCPKFDKYKIYKKKNLFYNNNEKERSIFLMFTWRKVKKGKNVSILYYDNIYNILNNKEINNELNHNNIKFYFCYHHTLMDKRKINVNSQNIRFISQNDISILLKNSSLIITDFSAILFDAIVQRKPLVLFIPDGLDPNLQEIYSKEYYETITKIKDGVIYLYEVFLEVNQAVNKILYYIKNGFNLEKRKLRFYKQFKLKNRDNTKKFIQYLKNL